MLPRQQYSEAMKPRPNLALSQYLVSPAAEALVSHTMVETLPVSDFYKLHSFQVTINNAYLPVSFGQHCVPKG
jgi:hypothetical protein